MNTQKSKLHEYQESILSYLEEKEGKAIEMSMISPHFREAMAVLTRSYDRERDSYIMLLKLAKTIHVQTKLFGFTLARMPMQYHEDLVKLTKELEEEFGL